MEDFIIIIMYELFAARVLVAPWVQQVAGVSTDLPLPLKHRPCDPTEYSNRPAK